MSEAQIEFLEALVRQLRFDFGPQGDLARRRTGLLWFRGEEIYYKRVSREVLEITLQGTKARLKL